MYLRNCVTFHGCVVILEFISFYPIPTSLTLSSLRSSHSPHLSFPLTTLAPPIPAHPNLSFISTVSAHLITPHLTPLLEISLQLILFHFTSHFTPPLHHITSHINLPTTPHLISPKTSCLIESQPSLPKCIHLTSPKLISPRTISFHHNTPHLTSSYSTTAHSTSLHPKHTSPHPPKELKGLTLD